MTRHRRQGQNGFTLVELMVSLGLGLTLIAGSVLVFINNNRSATQDEQLARMLENGRFVTRILSRELAMAGFWGKFLDIDTATEDASVAIGTDCGNGTDPWAMDLEALQLLNNVTAATVAANFACVDSATVVVGSDILAIKRVTDTETEDADLVSNQMYMRTNGTSATMFLGGAPSTPPAMGGTPANWAYVPKLFFLRNYSVTAGDNIPSLCQATLDTSSPPDMGVECLVDGVENFQVEFGVDDDSDFVADYYTAAPTAAELADAVAARIYVLVRSVNTVPGYTNDKSYTLGQTSVAAANDGYYRRMFNTTVLLRNPANLAGINS